MSGIVELPTLEDLKVREGKVSSSMLKAAPHHFGAQCVKPNKEFTLCQCEEKHPRRCLEGDKLLSHCALNFSRQMKQHCVETFTENWTGRDYSGLQGFRHCRCCKQEAQFDKHMLDKLGHQSENRSLSTENLYHSRAKPEPNPGTEGDRKPPKHSSCLFFWPV
uniref:Uncharacterized protein n=1 Tax=Sus scrofa TaxID=9823 RepID=A0A8W4F6P1_PIG